MGILNQAQEPEVSQEPEAIQGQEQPAKVGKNDNQKAFDQFAINSLKILHSPKVTDTIINRVVKAEDKVDAIGEIALDIINRLEKDAQKRNFKVTANTVIHGANTIVGDIISIAEAAGMEPLNDEQRYQALSWTMSNYINNAVKSGQISKEELIQLGQEASQTKEGKAIANKVMEDAGAQGQPIGPGQGQGLRDGQGPKQGLMQRAQGGM